jgi:hypothetical protein
MELNVKLVTPASFLRSRRRSLVPIGYEAGWRPGKIFLHLIGNKGPVVWPITSHFTHENFDINDDSFFHVIHFHPSLPNSTLYNVSI